MLSVPSLLVSIYHSTAMYSTMSAIQGKACSPSALIVLASIPSFQRLSRG